MADSFPSPSESETEEQGVGGCGWVQFLQVTLISLAAFFESQQSFISVYTDAKPPWHCTDNKICTSSSNICQLPKSAWNWDGIASKTIVSEWGLECSSAFIRDLPAISHFIGCLLGVIFLAMLEKSSISRKNLLFLSCLTMSVTTSLTIFSSNVWFYSLLRFLNGLGRAPIGRCTIGLLTDNFGRKWRGIVKFMDPFFFLLGGLSLPAIAYINKESSWKNIYLRTSIPALVYTATLDLFVNESPRWHSLQGHEEEIKILSPMKDRKVSLNHRNLLQRRCSLQRTLLLMILCFCIGPVFYGTTLGIGNMGFDIYMSVELNAFLYTLSFFVAKLLIKRRNWKCSLLMMLPVVRTCGFMLVGNESEEIKIGLELASFLSACSAYNMLLIYAIESINDTYVSNSATLMEREAISFGAIFSSVLVASGNNNEFLIYGVFGLVIVCCGLFAVCWNEKEDADPDLCDIMNEQEQKVNLVEC